MHRIHIVLCLIVITTITACKKDNGFGSGELPSESTLGLFFDEDNLLEVKTVYEDPLRTDRMLFNYLGRIIHPVFGETTAKTTVQYGLPDNINLEKGPFTVKETNLYLFHDAFYGDTTESMSISVQRLASPINTSITYKSNYIANTAEEIGRLDNYLLKPKTPHPFRGNDSISLTGFIEIPIDNSYGEEVRDLLETGLITNDTLFNNRFPGLFIETTSSQPGKAMVQLDMTHVASGLYIELSDRNGDDYTFILPFTTSKFVHTYLSHDYDGTIIPDVIRDGSSDGKLYIQSQAGVKTEVKISDIEKYKDKIINKAVLEIYEVESPAQSFLRVLSVYPLKKGSSGRNEAVNDYQPSFYGPAYMDTTKTGANGEKLRKFEINITDLFKNYALGKNEFESIYLTNYPVFSEQPKFIINENSVKSNNIEPSSLIFGSPDYVDAEKRMKLKVWYTE